MAEPERQVRVVQDPEHPERAVVLVDDQPLHGLAGVRIEHMGNGPVVQLTLTDVQEIHWQRAEPEEGWV
jgi:hypothetical protein